MNKKRGFTLIEIIICIGMLAVISVGSVVGINIVNKNLVKKGLQQITDKAIKATQVYIETNDEAQNQLYEKQNALYLPIKVLVNEGLLSLKGTNLSENDIKNQYTITALSTSTGKEEDCVDISTKASWDDSKAIFICTYNKTNDSEPGTSNENKLNIINQYGNSGYYIAKGSNPNNWVKFEVTAGDSNNDLAYFPGDKDKDLWRIVSIDENGGMKLVYNKDVKANNQLIYTNYNGNDKNFENSETSDNSLKVTFGLDNFCNSDYSKCFYRYKYARRGREGVYFYFWYAFYKLNTPYTYVFGNEYCEYNRKEESEKCRYNDSTTVYRYSELNGWNIMDLYDDAIYNNDEYKENTKLYYLYNNIKKRNWLDNVDTYLYYNQVGSIYEMDFGKTKKSKFSTIMSNDVEGSILFGKSWLYDYETISGISKQTFANDHTIYKLITLRGGSTDSNPNILQNPTTCSKDSCYSSTKQAFTINTSSYYPVIILKSNVKLKENKCNTKDKLGSKNCPYTLEWVDDVTDGAE